MENFQHGDDRNLLVTNHLPFARAVAHKYYNSHRNFGVAEVDFESAAYMGLCQAAIRYEHSGGAAFKSYSYQRIRGSIIDELRSNGSLPWTLWCEQLRQDKRGERAPYRVVATLRELKRYEQVHEAMNLKIVDGVDELSTELTYAHAPSAERQLLQALDRQELRNCILALPERERMIIVLHYFLEIPLADLSSFFNASKSWLSRLHTRALDRLKDKLEELHLQSMRSYSAAIN